MSTPSNSRNEHPSTYFVQDRQSKHERIRLMQQDRMLTTAMGGVLTEQPDPTPLCRVLDVGCGPGGWVIETAKTYPDTELVIGIDSSKSMIEYARTQATEQHISDRVEFHVMDALLILEFPPGFFDLVNMRLGISFVRTWEWRKLIGEMLRVCCPEGIVRITECESGVQSSSQALMRIFEMSACAMFRSGHLYEPSPTSITMHLPHLFTQYGCQHVQTKSYALEYRAGTEAGQAFYEDMQYLSETGRPFLQRWGCIAQNYDDLCQQALAEIQRPDFYAIWNFLTVWGHSPD